MLFKGFVLLLFAFKLFINFSSFKAILEVIEDLLNDYKKLDRFHDKIEHFTEKFNIFSSKFSRRLDKIKLDILEIDKPTNYYALLLNYTCINQLRDILLNNLEVTSEIILKRYKVFLPNNTMYRTKTSLPSDNKFFSYVLSSVNSYTSCFEENLESFSQEFLNIRDKYEIFEELKTLYLKNLVMFLIIIK